jgi:hypothetical protein
VERAVADPDGRVRLEGDIQAVRRVANPLGVGFAAETHFLFGDDRFTPWGAAFERGLARDGLQPQDTVTVGRLRTWIDAIRPTMGLKDEVADLVILAWAALRQRAWYLHGAPVTPLPRPGALQAATELRPEPMPAPGDWATATSRVEALFGLHVNPYLNTTAVTELVTKVGDYIDPLAGPAGELVRQLEAAYRRLALPEGESGRLPTARAAASLTDDLRRAAAVGNRVRLVELLAAARLPGTEPATASSLRSAGVVTGALRAFAWDRLAPLRAAAGQQGDPRGQAAARILDDLRDALGADEIAQALPRVLRETDDAIFDWLAGSQPHTPPPPPPDPGPGQVPGVQRAAAPSGSGTRSKGSSNDTVISQLGQFLRDHADEQVVVEWRVVE